MNYNEASNCIRGLVMNALKSASLVLTALTISLATGTIQKAISQEIAEQGNSKQTATSKAGQIKYAVWGISRPAMRLRLAVAANPKAPKEIRPHSLTILQISSGSSSRQCQLPGSYQKPNWPKIAINK